MHVLISTFEFAPAQVGGLGNIVKEIVAEISKIKGIRLSVVMPSHGLLWEKERFTVKKKESEFDVELGDRREHVSIYSGHSKESPHITVYLVSGGGLDDWRVYSKLPEKIALFSRAFPRFLDHMFWNGMDIDIIHAHDWHSAVASAFGKAEYMKRGKYLPMVYTVHRLAEEEARYEDHFLDWLKWYEVDDKEKVMYFSGYGWGKISLEALSAYYADRVVSVSKTYLYTIREFFQKFPFDIVAKSTYVFNGIQNSSEIKPKIKREERKKLLSSIGMHDAPMVLYVGRLDRRQKGFHVLLASIENYFSRRFDPEIERIVWDTKFILKVSEGDQSLFDWAKEMEKRYPDNVRVISEWVDISRYYNAADIVVVPSTFEPFGLVQVEAMARGCIVVGSDVGGIRDTVVDFYKRWDMVNDRVGYPTGFLAPPGNSDELANKLVEAVAIAKVLYMKELVGKNSEYFVKLLDVIKKRLPKEIANPLSLNPYYFEWLSKNAIKRARQFSIKRSSEEYVALYRSLLP